MLERTRAGRREVRDHKQPSEPGAEQPRCGEKDEGRGLERACRGDCGPWCPRRGHHGALQDLTPAPGPMGSSQPWLWCGLLSLIARLIYYHGLCRLCTLQSR